MIATCHACHSNLNPYQHRHSSPIAGRATCAMAPSMDVELAGMDDAPSAVQCTAYDETGALLATAHANGVLKLWIPGSNGSWEQVGAVRTPHPSACLSALTFAPTRFGTILATTGTDGVVSLHSMRVTKQTMHDALAPLRSVAWSEHGSLATLGDEGMARIYERSHRGQWILVNALMAVDFAIERDLPMPRPCALSFAKGKHSLFAGTSVFHRKSLTAPWRVASHPATSKEMPPPTCADWCSTHLALGAADGSVLLHGAEGQVAVLKSDQHVTPVQAVQWDPAGTVLAAAHEDGRVRTWAQSPKPSVYENHAMDDSHDAAWAWRLRETITV